MSLHLHSASPAVLALALALVSLSSAPATAADETSDNTVSQVVVNGKHLNDTIENAPSTRAVVTEDAIATTVNAVSVEDTLKYLPSLVVRKRHIGDNFAPIATRTSGLGASARSLIYADGALLSALIGNNNGNGGLVRLFEPALNAALPFPVSGRSGRSFPFPVSLSSQGSKAAS